MSFVPLVLVTDGFPYGGSEPFLEVELPYLAQHFDPVVLLPWTSLGEPRPVPAGTRVNDSLARSAGDKLRRHAAPLGEALTRHAVRRELGQVIGGRIGIAAAARLSSAVGRTWIARGVLRRVLHALGADRTSTVVYSYWLGPATLAASQLKQRYARLTVVSRAHGGDLYAERRSPPYLPLRRAILEGADAVYCVSGHGRHYLASRFPEWEAKLAVARLGIEPGGSGNPGSADSIVRVMSCSNLVPVKRVPLLVDALGIWASRHPGLRLRWTHFGDGADRGKVEQQARALPDTIRWVLEGSVRRQTVLDHYRATPVDVFINVSASEGVPVSIMEALDAGVPVLATDVGGVSELVHERNGVLLSADPSGHAVADGLDSILRRMATDPEWRQAIPATIRRDFDASHNYGEFCRNVLSLAARGATERELGGQGS